ncbi:MAG: TrbI/VirB10 family protein [Rhodospirillales bacterium]|nr:TrbI/VirB10 family protein [Rhodospirillales bacterium]
MQLPNLLPKWIADRYSDPEGSAPKAMITKGGIVLMIVLGGAVLLVAPSEEETASEDAAVSEELAPPAGPEGPASGERSIDEAAQLRQMEEERRERDRQAAAEAAERLRQMNEQYARDRQGRAGPAGYGGVSGYGPGGAVGGDPEMTPEQELRQSIRLGEIQRRHDSLRASPVALSLRGSAAASQPAPALPAIETTPLPVAAPPAQTRESPPPAGEPQPATRAEQALEEGDVVAATAQPRDPRGWERIDGGQWIEAVLVTQIRGDAPEPAIALVSTPLWSRDRQRILIPRGARFVGRALAVSNWEQSRLSVTFDRLIFDDYNLRLRFAGLSQSGEAGLKDQVNRHYLQTFGAAGAVGVIAGLTLRNTQSFGFNLPAGQAARMEAGRSLGESASAIMNRYLNRLPSITIRAGHRIRIYFTSDLLVPRRPA